MGGRRQERTPSSYRVSGDNIARQDGTPAAGSPRDIALVPRPLWGPMTAGSPWNGKDAKHKGPARGKHEGLARTGCWGWPQ